MRIEKIKDKKKVKQTNKIEVEKSDGKMPTEIIYKNPDTGKLMVAAKNLDEMVTIKAKKFYRLWGSSPRKLKLAL